jgi:Yip1 domain
MSTQTFVPLIGTADRAELWGWRGWVPTPAQVISAVQLRLAEAVGETETEPHTAMRQGFGLVVLAGLVAGALPFLVNWITAGRSGAALPLVRLAEELTQRAERLAGLPLPLHIWAETASTVAGLPAPLPGWLAAGLSALGNWINLPLGWLTLWLVYGLVVLLIAKGLGATTILPRFYAATAYAFAPLSLLILSPVPCLGWLASVVAFAWTLVVYLHAVRFVTRLSLGRTMLAVLLPAALMSLVILLVAGAWLIAMLGTMWG